MCSSVKSSDKTPLRASVLTAAVAALLAGYLRVGAAEETSQKTFSSAEEASRALFVAVHGQDTRALTQILGERNDLVSSTDPVEDKVDREQFVHKYQEMHRLVRERNGEVVLYVGAENWPFPIPLVSHNGVWQFDADVGEQEVLYRRVGENELTAIQACHALIATLKKPQAHADAANNPVAAVAAAATKADNKPVPYQGYDFRILPNSGSSTPAVVAYPTEYGSSGVMTFIVGGDGVVYEKDLGPSTTRVATSMAAYRKDSTWKPAESGV